MFITTRNSKTNDQQQQKALDSHLIYIRHYYYVREGPLTAVSVFIHFCDSSISQQVAVSALTNKMVRIGYSDQAV